MRAIRTVCWGMLALAIVLSGCKNDRPVRPGRQRTLILKFDKICRGYYALAKKCSAAEPNYGDWESRRRPIARHLPVWLKRVTLVRVRVVDTHAPRFSSPSLQQERFYIIFSVLAGQNVPGHLGLARLKLYHGCVGMVSPRFMADRKLGDIWQFAFTPHGDVVGVIPSGAVPAVPPKAPPK